MFIKNLIQFIKYKKTLQAIYWNERILVNFSRLFKSEFKQDWIGRIYTVINPRSEHFDPIEGSSTQIFEMLPDGTFDDTMFIEKYIMDKMNIASMMMKSNNLFELATYRISKLDDQDNWLFVIEPLPWQDLKKSAKRLGWFLLALAALGVAALIIF